MNKGEYQPMQLDLAVRSGLLEDALQLRTCGVGTDVKFFTVLSDA